MEDYYRRLKEVMGAKHISVYRVSQETGIDCSTFTKWSQGKTKPKAETLQKVCDCLGVSMSYIVNGFDDEEENYLSSHTIPVFRSSSCLGSDSNVLTYIEVGLNTYEEHFALLSRDDSMSPFILKKDVVIVHQCENIKNGKIAIVRVGKKDICGRIYLTDNSLIVSPLNYQCSPQVYTLEEIESIPVEIIGEIVEVRRKL